MLIVAPLCVVVKENFAVPDCPVVEVGAPPHLVMAPAMPPQMPSSATFWSWKTIFLGILAVTWLGWGAGRKRTYLEESRQVVDVTAAGFTAVEARMDRISRWSDRTITRGCIWYSVGAASMVREEESMAKSVKVGVGKSILVSCRVFRLL
jgi:hypothetical protein